MEYIKKVTLQSLINDKRSLRMTEQDITTPHNTPTYV